MHARPKRSCWHTSTEVSRDAVAVGYGPANSQGSKQAALYFIGLCIAAQKPTSVLLVIFFI